MKQLWILTGAPGSGKTTWANKQKNTTVISRDLIRLSLLSENEDYFAHENEVIAIFYDTIQNELNKNDDKIVIADASHLTPKRRRELTSVLNLKDIEVTSVYFDTPLDICIKRNAKRSGRCYVPNNVIARMRSAQTRPTFQEGFKNIIIVYPDGKEECLS